MEFILIFKLIYFNFLNILMRFLCVALEGASSTGATV